MVGNLNPATILKSPRTLALRFKFQNDKKYLLCRLPKETSIKEKGGKITFMAGVEFLKLYFRKYRKCTKWPQHDLEASSAKHTPNILNFPIDPYIKFTCWSFVLNTLVELLLTASCVKQFQFLTNLFDQNNFLFSVRQYKVASWLLWPLSEFTPPCHLQESLFHHWPI